MPRLTRSNPSYRKHKASRQAVVTINGRDVYLGPYGSKASRDEYDRLIGEWLTNGRRPTADAQAGGLAVVELICAYWAFCESYYVSENPGEIHSIRLVIRVLRRLYGRVAVCEFGPLALKSVRTEMVAMGWSRNYTNAQVGRLRRMFKWGVEQEMVPASILHALQAVAGLKRGRTEARETAPVKPVPDEHVDAVLPHLSEQVATMVSLQRITGMRPGEVCAMRGCDIDMTGRLWAYRPASHKNEHRGHERVIYLGPLAQELVRGFLRPRTEKYLFSPADAEAARRAKLHAGRETPLSGGNVPGSNRRRRPRRAPGDRYSVEAYRRAIARACQAAFAIPEELREPRTVAEKDADTPERSEERRRLRTAWSEQHVWHPHQLRHSAATRLRKEYGLEAAQVILGHKTLSVTEIYAEKNVAAAKRIMAVAG